MTNEEAINVLRGQESAYWDTFSGTEHKAFNLAVDALIAKQPRVLTLEEMKSLSTANDDALFDMDMTFVWLEAAADGYINITRPTYSFNPEWGIEDDSFYVYYIGTDVGDRLESCDYGKTWRCWTARPTDEQRDATPWDELPKEGDRE